uniref:Alpha-soluble NSF attachment protein n=1 Tax=Lactuca sativa TaxID=4236 RepID=A0A9R1UWQ6_LACSA|nr:hypothetical protein LSAT_V11C800443220 [Lactuca sativa]
MSDQIEKGREFEKKADKMLNGWGFFGSKFKYAGDLDQAGSVYVKLADCHLKQNEPASAYADTAHSYKKTSTKACIANLEQALSIFMEIGRLSMAARYCKQAISYYNKASDIFQGEEVTTSANQCKQKIAQFLAQLEQFQKAIEVYEEIAKQSLNNNLLKYGVRGHLLNAGICQLCKGDGNTRGE